MWVKLFITFLVFWGLAALQQGFLPHWAIFGIVPNLVFILFFVSIFREPAKEYAQGLPLVLVTGFFQATLVPTSFSGTILLLFVVYGLFKLTVQSFKQIQGKYLPAYFSILFCIFFSLWNISHYAFLGWRVTTFDVAGQAGVLMLVNLAVALAVLHIHQAIIKPNDGKQLSLFQ